MSEHRLQVRIDIGMDQAAFSPEDRQLVLVAFRHAGYNVEVGPYATKGALDTIAQFVLFLSAAQVLGVTRLCQLFVEQLYDEVLREALQPFFARLRDGAKSIQFFCSTERNSLTIHPMDGDDMERAMQQLRSLVVRLRNEDDLPLDPDEMEMIGYTNGSWRLGRTRPWRWWEYDADADDFRQYVAPPMTPDQEREWERETFGIEMDERVDE